jgi:hypothetical protein
MHARLFLLLASLALTACDVTRIYTLSATPGYVELAGERINVPDQQLADAAQAHCAQHGRNAVLTGRTDQLTLPNLLAGKAMTFRCDRRN